MLSHDYHHFSTDYPFRPLKNFIKERRLDFVEKRIFWKKKLRKSFLLWRIQSEKKFTKFFI